MLTLLANLVTLESVVYYVMMKYQATTQHYVGKPTQRVLLHIWILSSLPQQSLLQSRMFIRLELYYYGC